MGVRPHHDPALVDEFEQVSVAMDVREFHTYSVEWTPDYVAHYVDDRLVKVGRQSIAYPLQFLLGIYEFADGPEPPSPAAAYPKAFEVDWFRGSPAKRRTRPIEDDDRWPATSGQAALSDTEVSVDSQGGACALAGAWLGDQLSRRGVRVPSLGPRDRLCARHAG